MSVGSGPLNYNVEKSHLFRKERVGSQFQRKPKVVVPNCALIIPKRYKKGYEDIIHQQEQKYIEKKMKTVVN
jgi:hypothetical protein